MKDTSVIPKGDYCYKFDGRKGIDEETGLRMGVKLCPYYSSRIFNGVEVDWCDFLNCGDIGNDLEEGDYQKLIEYFGSEEKLHEYLPLFLLWDQVKECGENYYDQEDKE